MADITSAANPRVKALVRLRRRRERDAAGTFLIDGAREVGRALDAGVTLETLFVCWPDGDGDTAGRLAARAQSEGAELVTMTQEPFRKVAYGDRDRGLLAVARQFPTSLDRLAPVGVPLLLVVEAIEKPGNLGTMLRTAAAAGADAVLVADPATDVFNPNVIRASLGALFDVPLATATADDARRWLDENAIPWLASSAAGAMQMWSADMAGPIALVVGSEDAGLSTGWLSDPARVVRIPTVDRQHSLNAAMAAGLLLFEASRQRRTAAQGAT